MHETPNVMKDKGLQVIFNSGDLISGLLGCRMVTRFHG